MTRAQWIVVIAIVACVLLCSGSSAAVGIVAIMSGQDIAAPVLAAADGCGTTNPAPTGNPNTRVPGFTAEQTRNAAVIISTGQLMQVPPRGWVIAVATAMQESNLINHGNLGARNDHDSLGLFQQRPSTGWGSPADIMRPEYAARQFYEHLLKVPNWATLPLTVAAQRVQRSAFPNAYAKHEPAAARLVGAVTGGADHAAETPGVCAPAGQVNAGGWVLPVPGGVVSGFRTASRPTHNGVDLAAAKRTVIRSATAGTVIKAICDPATTATRGSCDVDGSPQTKGCGWYVDIAHADGVMTRYCHMIQQPLVQAGQQVTAGQQIGWSGTSGNSSGPHVHFEVHTGGDRSKTGATDPVPFMRQHGAVLGGA
jgi:murein DD-endopeptidase MepM/ murein hydrolase activator NlpD